MLRISQLQVRYGGVLAVNDVSLEVERGETVLLVGSNGAGKSSIINAVIGLVPAPSGSISLNGRVLDRLSCSSRARVKIGYSPEGRRTFPTLSVLDNVLSGASYLSGAAQRRNLEWIYQALPLVRERAAQPANQLSGGEQQVVALARAIISEPDLLLLDEPFLGLAPVWIARISDAIRQLQARGMTILMTEQMARPALKLARRAYVLRGGEVRRSGRVDEIRGAALAEEYL